MEEEKAVREQKKKERDEQHLYQNVKVITQNQFKAHQGFDLAYWDNKEQPEEAQPKVYRMLKSAPVQELVEKVAEGLGNVDPSMVRLWVMVNRQNKTVRPDQPLTALEMSKWISTHHTICRPWF